MSQTDNSKDNCPKPDNKNTSSTEKPAVDKKALDKSIEDKKKIIDNNQTVKK
jgi:hypothetical protein